MRFLLGFLSFLFPILLSSPSFGTPLGETSSGGTSGGGPGGGTSADYGTKDPEDECPPPEECEDCGFPGMCGGGPSTGSGATNYPIYLTRGAVIEREVDLSLPGPEGGWSFRRSYDSRRPTSNSTTTQGYRWIGSLTEFFLLQPDASTIEFYADASTRRRFVKTGSFYQSPSDFWGDLTEQPAEGDHHHSEPSFGSLSRIL